MPKLGPKAGDGTRTSGTDATGGEWVADDQKRTASRSRRNDIVRIRRLNSGPTPTVGVTIPSKVLTASGLDLGDRVYVLIEEDGRLIIERVSRGMVGRMRERSQLLPLMPNEQKWIKEELTERVRTLEMDMVELEGAGQSKAAKLKRVRADRVRWLIRKVGGSL